jgi:phage shock protein PspC (stress-responsive transcriptional regulator)
MKKIININFHSRVIPIEETAYDILRKYVESLKNHFAGEDGADEIVNDIENRFAELFSDRLKKGATCITDADVNEIITSMGRPEDFDQEEGTGTNGNSAKTSSSTYAEETISDGPHRLYRSENDKMLGGVCGGIAAYLKIDSSVVRIIFAFLTLGFGTGILVYMVLWVVLPPKSMVTNIRKRLFRDSDHRMIGGVASGLAAYFNIDIWIPRVIFCLPLILGVIRSIFRHIWFDFDSSFSFIANGFGGGLTTIYIILWIVLPEARSASEKLEMRGEKIDLESIKNTIKNDLEGFKQKATVVGGEIKQRAEEFGNEMKNRSGNIRKDISSSVNAPRNGIGHAIGVLFKAFFLFISVIITFALVTALIGIIFTGAGILPLKDYFIQGFWQNILMWSVLLLFLILPVVGLLTWLIRRIIGARRGGTYLGYIFGSLWVVGLVSLIILVASFSRHFSTRNGVEETISLSAPTNGRMVVKMDDIKPVFFESDWMGLNWHHQGPFFDLNEDSLTMNNVRIEVAKSEDSAWHLNLEKISRGNTSSEAKEKASEIDFQIDQKDSMLVLPRGFVIKPKQQFRNQQIVAVIKVPVGKKIFMSENLSDYHWFNINRKWHDNGFNLEYDDSDNSSDNWESDTEYIMTQNGLEKAGKSASYDNEQPENPERPEKPEKKEAPERKEVPDDSKKKTDNPNGEYRYHKPKTANSASSNKVAPEGNLENKTPEAISTLALLTRMS